MISPVEILVLEDTTVLDDRAVLDDREVLDDDVIVELDTKVEDTVLEPVTDVTDPKVELLVPAVDNNDDVGRTTQDD